MYVRFYKDYSLDCAEDAPVCGNCNHPLEPDADVDIDEDTRRHYVSGWSFLCKNRNCPEPPDS